MSLFLANKLISHRGAWSKREDQNSNHSLMDALSSGFGVETDLRDVNGSVGISHDPIDDTKRKTHESFLQFVETAKEHHFRGPLALNIKCDGLQELHIQESLEGLSNFFFFDMSIPEQVRYARVGLPFAIRVSEFESFESSLLIKKISKPAAIWLDGFDSDWFLDPAEWGMLKKRSELLPIVIVSPELHGRDSARTIEAFLEEKDNPNILLCTDMADEVLSGNF